MKNRINKNTTLFVITILFCLILNEARANAKTNDEIKKQIRYQFYRKPYRDIFSDVIDKLPTFDNKIYGIEYLYELVRNLDDVGNTEEVFEFVTEYKKYNVVAPKVRLPQCVDAIVFNSRSRHICFDTGEKVLKPYSNKNATTSLPYLLYEGNCQTERSENNFYWKVTSDSHKSYSIKNLQTLDGSRQLKNVEFELAPDGQRCYINVDGHYLTQDGETEHLTMKDEKSPNGIWSVKARYFD